MMTVEHDGLASIRTEPKTSVQGAKGMVKQGGAWPAQQNISPGYAGRGGGKKAGGGRGRGGGSKSGTVKKVKIGAEAGWGGWAGGESDAGAGAGEGASDVGGGGGEAIAAKETPKPRPIDAKVSDIFIFCGSPTCFLVYGRQPL
jgi:hypothetical protein